MTNFLTAEEIDTKIDNKIDIDRRVTALEQIAVSVKDAQRFDRRIALGIMSIFVAAAIAFFTLTQSDISSIKTDLAILQDDVETLKDDVEIMKDDIEILKDDVEIMKVDVEIMKVDVADLKKGQTRIFNILETEGMIQ